MPIILLYAVNDGHTLQHYLQDCPRVNTLREHSNVAEHTLTDLTKHFLTIPHER